MKYILTTLVIALLAPTCFGDDIPPTVLLLQKIQDKNSEAYIFNASYAAIDAKNAAIAALQGEDSAKALKILTAALEVMPHYDELRTLRNKSLEAVINITKKLETDSIKNCSVLLERYKFLSVIAPDSLTNLKHDKNCDNDPNKLPPLPYNAFNVPTITPIKSLEQINKVDLTRDLDYYINRNNNFPYDALILNSFTYVFKKLASHDLESTFEIQCSSLAIDPNATNPNSVKVQAECRPKSRARIEGIEQKYDEILKEQLEIPNGTEPIRGQQFYTSKPLHAIYDAGFAGGMFHHRAPTYFAMEIILRYKDRDEKSPILVKYGAGLELVDSIKKIPFSNLMQNLYLPDRSVSPTQFVLDAQSLKGLLSISFVFDLKKTLELYQKHFKNHVLLQIENSKYCTSNDQLKRYECINRARYPGRMIEDWKKGALKKN